MDKSQIERFKVMLESRIEALWDRAQNRNAIAIENTADTMDEVRLDPKNLGLKLALSQVRRQQKNDRQATERDPRETLREDLRPQAPITRTE